MRIALLLIALLLAAAVPAAQYNPRASHTELPLNGVLTLVFSTSMPQREHIDIAASVRQTCEQSSVVALWRLAGPPEVRQHERARDVQVTLRLMPRRVGELQPPAIPVHWMEGSTSASFASVRITPELELGTRRLPLPKQLDGVGGYDWGLSWDEFLKRVGRPLTVDATGMVDVKPGLRLRFAAHQLAGAELLTPGLPLAQSRASLMERWGTPAEDDPATGMRWYLGWLQITAAERDGGTLITMRHEGIDEQALRQQVHEQVFDVLDGPARATPAPTPSEAAPAGTGAGEPATAAPAEPGVAAEDIEKEWQRSLERAAKPHGK